MELILTTATHILFFEFALRVCKVKAANELAFTLFLQSFGVLWLIGYLTINDIDMKSLHLSLPLITWGFIYIILTKKKVLKINKKEYSGFRKYYILLDTDLKYVFILFMSSFIANMFLNPFKGTFNYMQITVLLAFAGSIIVCRKMNEVAQQTIRSNNG